MDLRRDIYEKLLKWKAAKQVLTDHNAEAVYFLKGDTYGGIEGNMITMPIYLASRVRHDYVRAES